MTEAAFVTFVKNQLRAASRKWKPINEVFKAARVGRGLYLCAECQQIVPLTRNKKKWVSVDHKEPIVNPHTGFTTWDSFINNLFCEEENLQTLCGDCHTKKSKEERLIATLRRREEKE